MLLIPESSEGRQLLLLFENDEGRQLLLLLPKLYEGRQPVLVRFAGFADARKWAGLGFVSERVASKFRNFSWSSSKVSELSQA